jgi:uncharacterized protein (DUF1499 family)
MTRLFLLLIILMCPQAYATPSDLKACPNKPNCVSSKATDEHAVEPFIIDNVASLDLQKISNIISTIETNVVIIRGDKGIHAEFTSFVFKFVDDMDLLVDTEQKLIHVRSASRKGHYDFGVNHRRVEKLRTQLKKANLIQ